MWIKLFYILKMERFKSGLQLGALKKTLFCAAALLAGTPVATGAQDVALWEPDDSEDLSAGAGYTSSDAFTSEGRPHVVAINTGVNGAWQNFNSGSDLDAIDLSQYAGLTWEFTFDFYIPAASQNNALINDDLLYFSFDTYSNTGHKKVSDYAADQWHSLTWSGTLSGNNDLTFMFLVSDKSNTDAASAVTGENYYIDNVQLRVLTPVETIDWQDLETKRVASKDEVIWEQVSPGNAGFANVLRYHPTIPNWVMLCPDMWNVYQSENDGGAWYGITDFDGDGSMQRWSDFWYGVSDPDLALGVCQSELFISRDRAKTWEIVKNCPWYNSDTDGSDKDGWKSKVATIGIDPSDADTWFVGGGMNNRGQKQVSWSTYCTSTAANPQGKEDGVLNMGKLWRTKDAGATWQEVTTGLHTNAQMVRIIVNPTNSLQVFAASNYGLYESDDGGTTWANIGDAAFDNNIIMDMDYYYNEQNGTFILYLIDQVHHSISGNTTVCNGGIYRSEDAGATWIKMNGDLGLDLNRLGSGVDSNYNKFLQKWLGSDAPTLVKPNLPTEAIQFFSIICADPSQEGRVYVGFHDPQTAHSFTPGRLWKTENNGAKWINTARLYEYIWEKDKAYWEERDNPWHENMIVTHESPHMHFGWNYAERSMRGISVGVDGDIMMISDHSTMLSTDHGETWQQMDEQYYNDQGEELPEYVEGCTLVGRGNSNLPGITLHLDYRNESTFLGAGEHRLWIPTGVNPGGKTGIKYIETATETVANVALDPYNPYTIFTTSQRQSHKQNLARSTDGGHSWNKDYGVASPATTAWNDDFYSNGLLVNPVDSRYVYHGITKIVDSAKGHMAGFYVSDDFGKTFTQSNTGLPDPVRVSDIEMDPRDPTRNALFIAVQRQSFTQDLPSPAEGGLYHSADHGATWTQVPSPAGTSGSEGGIQRLEIDHTGRLYVSTGYRPGWLEDGGKGVWYTDNWGQTWTQIFNHPEAVHIEVSPFDHNFLAVSAGYLSKNPGIYISRDRGQSWSKANTNIVIPHRIQDIEFDLFNPAEMWTATLGCGFYKGKIKGGSHQVVDIDQNAVEILSPDLVQLNAAIVNPEFSGANIVWKSENEQIATVDANGVVTPRMRGQVNIWATAEDGRYSDYSVVTVHCTPNLNR